MSLRPDSYQEYLRRKKAWDERRRECQRRYEERKREEGSKYRSIGHNAERKQRNHERAYGGEERVRWVKDMDCLVPGCSLPAENAHLPGAGGMGYKGDADTVVNLCHPHHSQLDNELGSADAFNEEFDVDLEAEARRLQEAWEARG